ncbi:integumentary mucin C.1-like [Hydractinia symbiolongicarpus]|uniref:integumentary mucin C.1-like n=1 Tax=Hydractinia symbiolongicarpus TaxID=13093 RepID=UPI00254EE174|nr:integumentary mucin C.1-like [Hydractinia symbiolongicarpus]
MSIAIMKIIQLTLCFAFICGVYSSHVSESAMDDIEQVNKGGNYDQVDMKLTEEQRASFHSIKSNNRNRRSIYDKMYNARWSKAVVPVNPKKQQYIKLSGISRASPVFVLRNILQLLLPWITWISTEGPDAGRILVGLEDVKIYPWVMVVSMYILSFTSFCMLLVFSTNSHGQIEINMSPLTQGILEQVIQAKLKRNLLNTCSIKYIYCLKMCCTLYITITFERSTLLLTCLIFHLGYESNFDISEYSQKDGFGVKYDSESIMHYGRFTFAKSGSAPTIVLKSNPNQPLGGRKLTPSDIRQMNLYYECDGFVKTTTTTKRPTTTTTTTTTTRPTTTTTTTRPTTTATTTRPTTTTTTTRPTTTTTTTRPTTTTTTTRPTTTTTTTRPTTTTTTTRPTTTTTTTRPTTTTTTTRPTTTTTTTRPTTTTTTTRPTTTTTTTRPTTTTTTTRPTTTTTTTRPTTTTTTTRPTTTTTTTRPTTTTTTTTTKTTTRRTTTTTTTTRPTTTTTTTTSSTIQAINCGRQVDESPMCFIIASRFFEDFYCNRRMFSVCHRACCSWRKRNAFLVASTLSPYSIKKVAKPTTTATTTTRPTTTTKTTRPTTTTTTTTTKTTTRPTTTTTTTRPTTTTTTTRPTTTKTTTRPTTTTKTTTRPTTTTTTRRPTTTTTTTRPEPNIQSAKVCGDETYLCARAFVNRNICAFPKFCRRSCGLCSGPSEKMCDLLVDAINVGCKHRRRRGHCVSNNKNKRRMMKQECPRTCCMRGQFYE